MGINIPIVISGLERAIMEALYLIPKNQSLDEAYLLAQRILRCLRRRYLLMQGLHSIRPEVMQKLLENCNSIRVKRLFMHLTELHDLPFLKHINKGTINFGKGKRMIGEGGIYHSTYQLSLPKLKEEE